MTNSGIKTNFATNPYYDDYNEDKNFHHILYKPGQAVQGRELNQTQSIAQNQIARFGSHIFKEGSIVTGGQFILDDEYRYLKIKDLNPSSVSVNVGDFLNKTITEVSTGITAIVLNVVNGSENTNNPKTLIMKYINTASDNVTKTFAINSVVTTANNFTAQALSTVDTVGNSYLFTIKEGVIFAKNHFIKFPEQTIVIGKYTNKPSVKIGFTVQESIINASQDSTLFDPASGSTNFGAPGADRLKLYPVLAQYDINQNTTSDFISLFEIKDGVLQEKYERPQYSLIRDELARRTDDESGSYYIKGLNIRIREHLKNLDNGGLNPLPIGNNSLLSVGIEPGKAYIRGYDYETLITNYVTIRKGIDVKNVEQAQVSSNYGNYVLVNECVGVWNVNSNPEIDLYNAPQTRITSRSFSIAAQMGTLIGKAKLKSIILDSGTPGTANAKYRLYLYDVNMTTQSFENVRSIYFNNGSAPLCADVVLSGGIASLEESTFNTGLFPVGTDNIRKIRDETNSVDTTYQFEKSFDITISTAGTFSVTSGSSAQILPYSIGLLNSTQKRDLIVSIKQNATVTLPGTISIASGTNTVSGTGTTFTNLNIGDKVIFTGNAAIYIIGSIISNTAMTLTTNAVVTYTSATYVKSYQIGDILDFSNKGATGVIRTVTETNVNTIDFDMKETLSNTITATATIKLAGVDVKEIRKDLRKNRLVQISCTDTIGPWNLGVSDVYRINSIRKKTGSAFTTTSEGVDVTTVFDFDNGQRDSHYDHAKISRKTGTTVLATDYLLVSYDYFSPDFSQGYGYFSIDSYPIDDVLEYSNLTTMGTVNVPVYVSPVNGNKYDLRNHIDSRPVKTNTANDTTVIAGISTNPAITQTFASNGSINAPYPNEAYILDYSYYMPRRDIIAMDSLGALKVIEGISDTNPITPETPEDSMAIASLYIKPYPSLAPDYAEQKGRKDLAISAEKVAFRRYTERDVGVLDKRISNLEYYSSLSLLEKKAIDMKITDENGLDRFKNGIFVDPFSSHILGDIGNPDYKITIDPIATEIRPLFEKNIVDYQYSSGSGVSKIGNLVMLAHTEELFMNQRFATSTRNTAGFLYNFKGTLSLSPDSDYWTDTVRTPDIQSATSASAIAAQNLSIDNGAIWNDWQSNWSGVSADSRITQNTNRVNLPTITTTENVGDRVIDTSIIPFMRSRQIQFVARGMKPNTKLYAFFDGENVSDYITVTNSNYVATSAEGINVRTDSLGVMFGIFRLPNTDVLKFRAGTKLLHFTDSLTNSNSSTTTSEAAYTSTGLTQRVAGTFVTTSTFNVQINNTLNVNNITNTTVQNNTNNVNNIVNVAQGEGGENGGASDPVAQTFIINTRGESSAIQLTSIGLFFKDKDPTLGVTIELRPTTTDSNIEKIVLPYSKVYVPSSAILISDTATVETKIQFTSPITLLDEEEYAVVILPEQNNPNTVVWTARLGEDDITTGNRVTEQPNSGVFFASSNNRTWSPIQEEDLKFKLYRANFIPGSTGNFTISNLDKEYFNVVLPSGAWNTIEEIVHGETRLTLAGISGGTIQVGNIIRGDTSGATGIVTNITGSIYRVKNVSTVKYITGENLTILNAVNIPIGIVATLFAQTTPTGKLEYYRAKSIFNIKLVLKNTTGSFVLSEELKGQSSGNTALITVINHEEYSVVNFESSHLEFRNTSLNWNITTLSNSNIFDAVKSINKNDNTKFDVVKKIAGRTEEISLGNKSIRNTCSISTNTKWVSPIVDLNRTYAVAVNNFINNDVGNETQTSGGNALNKYISQKIVLDNGQDAEDLRVIVTGYVPTSTADIKVYMKIIHNEDSDTFNDRRWVEMTKGVVSNLSSKEDQFDYREISYSIPNSMLLGTYGEVRYTNTKGVTFQGFRRFQLKIILTGVDGANVPKAADVRAIALQK